MLIKEDDFVLVIDFVTISILGIPKSGICVVPETFSGLALPKLFGGSDIHQIKLISWFTINK